MCSAAAQTRLTRKCNQTEISTVTLSVLRGDYIELSGYVWSGKNEQQLLKTTPCQLLSIGCITTEGWILPYSHVGVTKTRFKIHISPTETV